MSMIKNVLTYQKWIADFYYQAINLRNEYCKSKLMMPIMKRIDTLQILKNIILKYKITNTNGKIEFNTAICHLVLKLQ